MTTTATADTKTQDQESPLSRIGRLRRRLFHNDPNDDLTLQPHIDEKLTKKSELWSFFLFGFGYYSWANSCASLLLPILVQGIARNASHLESDPSVPCPETDPVNDRCLVPFGWIRVTPTSYVLLTNVVTVWCTIVLTLGVSALADHGRVSKRIMLFTSTLLCVIACFIFLGALEPSVWWLTTLLFVLTGIVNGPTQNFYDAHIPILTRYHPDVVRVQLQEGEASEAYIDAKTKVQTFLSGGSSAAGYAGGMVLTIICAIILLMVSEDLITVGYCVIVAGVYIFIFVCFYAKYAVQRTFPPLPAGSHWATYGYVRIGKTISKARRLKTLFFFLCTWFILGDGLAASSSMAVLIAQDQLKLDSSSLIIAALIQMIAAGLGMIFWIRLQNRHGVSPLKIVIFNTVAFGLIPCYCLLGLIEGCPIGLKQEWELYMLAAFFGIFSGAIYSSNRVVFAQFIPYGHENELFALYEMSSVSSSWIAPLVCTAIIQSSSVRQTWWFLASQFFLPAVLLLFVNVDKGRAEGIEFYKQEQERKKLKVAGAQAEEAGSGSVEDEERDIIKNAV
ncbi:MAG: autophagy-related protein 22-like protein [Linnemannia elongata]|nr:MAG: autophagy-related protein 22-like protein [Linnemannia elongata]